MVKKITRYINVTVKGIYHSITVTERDVDIFPRQKINEVIQLLITLFKKKGVPINRVKNIIFEEEQIDNTHKLIYTVVIDKLGVLRGNTDFLKMQIYKSKKE